MSLDRLHPLSTALPIVMQIDIPENATGEVGFLNYGWYGKLHARLCNVRDQMLIVTGGGWMFDHSNIMLPFMS